MIVYGLTDREDFDNPIDTIIVIEKTDLRNVSRVIDVFRFRRPRRIFIDMGATELLYNEEFMKCTKGYILFIGSIPVCTIETMKTEDLDKKCVEIEKTYSIVKKFEMVEEK